MSGDPSASTTKRPRIVIVVAAARNGTIGRAGALPWRMPSDLALFRRRTLGRPVIMGRKTFQSIGRPLDGRDNIVISRDPAFQPQGALAVASLEAALAAGAAAALVRGADEIMVLGGVEVFRQSMRIADCIQLTRIDADVEGDAAFEPPDPTLWRLVRREALPPHPRDQFAGELLTYERNA